MRAVTHYEAFDGLTFATADECRAHEAKHIEGRLANLSVEDIVGAIDGSNPELAEAIERVGRRCAEARRERGELKRKPRVEAV